MFCYELLKMSLPLFIKWLISLDLNFFFFLNSSNYIGIIEEGSSFPFVTDVYNSEVVIYFTFYPKIKSEINIHLRISNDLIILAQFTSKLRHDAITDVFFDNHLSCNYPKFQRKCLSYLLSCLLMQSKKWFHSKIHTLKNV